MHFVKNSAVVAFVSLAASANAHMIMASPKPFDSPAVSSSPLDTNNFPCQSTGGGYSGSATQMALGSTQKLSFKGVATHGGGSCQVSVSYDEAPNKDSVWKVIHSIEGGCVADVEGNISTDPARAQDATPGGFDYPIPADIPAGKATIAWSWLNRIGNREFYMNCAPVEFTGTGGSKANYEALPDMLVTNIPANNNVCGVNEGSDYKYPNPGKSVVRLGTIAKLIDLNCPANVPGGTPGKSSSGGGSDSGSGSSQPSKTGDSSGSVPTATKPGGIFAPAPSPSSSTSSKPSTPAPTGGSNNGSGSGSGSGSGTSPTSKASTPAPTGGSSSGGSGSPAGAQAVDSDCSPEGTWNCIGGVKYQQCASGKWSVVRDLAAGMSCEAGMGSTIKLAALGRRRAVGFSA